MIQDIRLQNFRSYADDSFEFDPGVNIIVGPNASGKTNLLEAILVSCYGSSYRARDAELVHHKSDWARLDAHADGGLRTVKLEKNAANRLQKTFILNQKILKRLPLAKTLPVVLFEPEDLRLLTGAPERRRDFLDDLLEKTVPEFGLLRRQYKRALLQRNSLLKKGPNYRSQLFPWNVRLSELGGKIADYRSNLIDRLNDGFESIYRELSHTKLAVRMEYAGTCRVAQYGSHLLEKLEASNDLDFQRGFTTYGPHRDDAIVLLNDRPVGETASRGEVRTLLLALKILELKIIEEVRSHRPILLLDDVFSELDGARRRALTEFLSGHQAFITTTDADVVVQHFMDKCRIIPTSQ